MVACFEFTDGFAQGQLGLAVERAFHGVSKKHMQRYLDEFVFRFDRRVNEYGLLRALLNRVARSEPYPYARLTAETIG